MDVSSWSRKRQIVQGMKKLLITIMQTPAGASHLAMEPSYNSTIGTCFVLFSHHFAIQFNQSHSQQCGGQAVVRDFFSPPPPVLALVLSRIGYIRLV